MSAILSEALHTALGSDVMRLLALPDLTDLFLNDDGRLWSNRTGIGRKDSGCVMSHEMAYSALCLIAGATGKVITKDTPTLSAIIPESRERVEGSIPPKSARATFAIRKPPASVFPLETFDPDCRFIPTIKDVFAKRKNVLLAGGTGSGKTSLLSSVLALPTVVGSRCIIIEDEREIMTSAPDHKRFLVSNNESLRALVKSALRSNPERIILGEVRDGQAANEMLTALATGHPGSATSIHANNAEDALYHLADLLGDIGPIPYNRIARAFHCVVFMLKNENTGRREIAEVILVNGYADGRFLIERCG